MDRLDTHRDCEGVRTTGEGKLPWYHHALSRSTVQRSLIVAAIVGSVLALINHGDAIMIGLMTPDRWLRIGLTYLVPYVVATYGVVSAVREQEMLQRIAAKKGKT